jgi:hypothetical protein
MPRTDVVGWRGVQLDPRSAAMMDEVANIVPAVPVHPTQGSFSSGVGASAGTHAGGGAIDLRTEGLTRGQREDLVAAMRRVGWAAWLRRPGQGPWPMHIHGVAVDCPSLSPAARVQVADYLAGLNGLANKQPDDGPRDHVGVTWETYQEDPVITDADIDKIARKVWKYQDEYAARNMQWLVRNTYRTVTAPPPDTDDDE